MLGERIYQLRVRDNLSQLDLADALEVSRQSVSKWENNVCAPELDKLVKMSELFQVSLDELVRGGAGSSETLPLPVGEEKQAEEEKPDIRRGLGIALVGAACLVMAGSFLWTSRWLIWLAAAVMLLVLGTVCLLVKTHTALCCIWAAFLMGYISLERIEPGFLLGDLNAFLWQWLWKNGLEMRHLSGGMLLFLGLLIGVTYFTCRRKKGKAGE